LEFVILTASRGGEVTGMQWDEVDCAKREWVVPASRMKAHREHRVPLSDAALAVLKRQADIRHSDLVFPGRIGRMGANSLSDMLKALSVAATPHGFRSSFRDWCSEKTSVPREIAEMSLAHKVGTAVERAYARSTLFEKRAELMEAWGRYCNGIGAAVTPLRDYA
jgi:integrase